MKKLLFLFVLFYQSVAFALPYAEFKVVYLKDRSTGTFTYVILNLTNVGPIAENVATEPGHGVFDWQTNTFHPAGGLSLNDDEQLFQFGVDTLRDDVVISNISNGVVSRAGQRKFMESPFQGVAMDGFDDHDNNGISNKIIVWQLPDESDLTDALQVGDAMHWVMFRSDRKLDHFNIWVHGSDDAQVWGDPGHITLHGDHGHFDVTDGAYLSVLMERRVTPKRWR